MLSLGRITTDSFKMRFMKYIKTYSTIFITDITTSIALFYLWNKGYKYLASTISLCGIGKNFVI